MENRKETKKKLSSRQIRFIEYYCSGMSAMEAYRQAGYEGDPNQNAWKIHGKSGVREAINEKMNEFITSVNDAIKQTAMQAFEIEKNLMLTAENEFARIKASQDIMDRAGLKPRQSMDVDMNMKQDEMTIIIKPASEAFGIQVNNDPIGDDDKPI